MEKFSRLWLNPNFAVIANRKEIKEFVETHENQYGIPIIIVKGYAREIKWKSLGAGLYRVYTLEY